jgi:radical SAM superfamily enzyme YgiQ (UPF0313 family)
MIKETNLYHGHGISEPIGLEYLASQIFTISSFMNFISNIELEVMLKPTLRISFISSTTADFPLAIIACKNAAQRGNITVAGGYHISGNHKDEDYLPFDYIVLGEGEDVIKDIIKEILSGNIYKNPGNCPKVIFSKPIEDLNSLKFPIRDKAFLGNYMLNDLMYPATTDQKNTAIILGSRGCKYSCSFCASASVWGTGLRMRSIQNIISEIKEVQDKFESNTFVFIDQSLGQQKKWTIELCNAIVKNGLILNWYHQSNINIDKELITVMAEAGCRKIGFGIEGISPFAISRIKPVNTPDFNYINDLFLKCNDNGIFVKAYLIMGFPWESKKVIDDYFEYLPQLKANMIKISFFTPFPGTADWNKYKSRLITRDWSKFDTVQMPVVKNAIISVDEYLRYREKLFHTFYGSEEYKRSNEMILAKFPYYRKSFIEFFKYLSEFEMIPGDSDLKNWINKLPFNNVA